MSDSTVTLVGNLTRDPELRFTTGGSAVVSFGIACSRRYQQDGEWKEQTSFHNVVAWRDLAENVAASLVKGNRVIVTGRLDQRNYDDSEGNKRSIVEVTANAIGPDLRWATAEVTRIERENEFKKGDSSKADDLPPEEPF